MKSASLKTILGKGPGEQTRNGIFGIYGSYTIATIMLVYKYGNNRYGKQHKTVLS